jgi:hypothetical protein
MKKIGDSPRLYQTAVIFKIGFILFSKNILGLGAWGLEAPAANIKNWVRVPLLPKLNFPKVNA